MADLKERECLLKVEHLCQYFGAVKAVDDVSFEIRKGEVFGLVGESGCGKTTTGRSIIRIYDITSGNIYFKGRRICAGTEGYKTESKECDKRIRELKKQKTPAAQQEIAQCRARQIELKTEMEKAQFDHFHSDSEYAKELVQQTDEKYAPLLKAAQGDAQKLAKLKKEYQDQRRIAQRSKLITQIQMIFQDPIASLNPRMTVKEIISEGLIIQGVKDKAYIDEKTYEILELVGLPREYAGRYPHEFSGGQRQRIGIARAVIMRPELLIADEPVSALDVSIQAQVINLLNDLRKTLDLTILFIAHDLSVVKYFSDRIGVMYFGKMVELASSDELFAHPLHPYTKSLLSAIPLPDPHAEKKRKRLTYNPLNEHDYEQSKPSLREIAPGHFVHCNDAEELRYKEELHL